MSLIHRYQAFSPPISRLPTGESEEGSPRVVRSRGKGKGKGKGERGRRFRRLLLSFSPASVARPVGQDVRTRPGPLGSQSAALGPPPLGRPRPPRPPRPLARPAAPAGKKKFLGLWRPLGHNFDQLINSTETGPGQLITGGGRVGRPGEPVDRGARREGGRRGKMEGTEREPVGQGGLAGRGL